MFIYYKLKNYLYLKNIHVVPFYICCIMQNDMECTKCFGEEITNVRPDVLAYVHRRPFVNKL